MQTLGWRSVFVADGVAVAAATALVAVLVPCSGTRRDADLDALGGAVLTGGLSVILVAITEGASLDWTSPWAVGGLAVGAASVAAWIWRDLRGRRLDLRVLGRRTVPLANLATIGLGLVMFATLLPRAYAAGRGCDPARSRLSAMLRGLCRATWGRTVACVYDWFMSAAEKAGLRERRRELLRDASGACLEIGAGTGLNLELWPDSVESLVLTEPDPHMTAQLRKRVVRSGRPAQVVEALGEQLPFDDANFDSVAITLVLCTAPNPAAVLGEVGRVLRPGGRLFFLEHVRADDPKLARWQDRLHGPWYAFGYGCNCNRATLATVEASALEVERVEHGEIPKAPPDRKADDLGDRAGGRTTGRHRSRRKWGHNAITDGRGREFSGGRVTALPSPRSRAPGSGGWALSRGWGARLRRSGRASTRERTRDGRQRRDRAARDTGLRPPPRSLDGSEDDGSPASRRRRSPHPRPPARPPSRGPARTIGPNWAPALRWAAPL